MIRRYVAFVVTIVLGTILAVGVGYLVYPSPKVTLPIQKELTLQEVIKRRLNFYRRHSKSEELLLAIESDDHEHILENVTDSFIEIRGSRIFYTLERINAELSIDPSLSPREKAKVIHDFVHQKVIDAIPLYENRITYSPMYFLSTLAGGWCAQAAGLMGYLSKEWGMPARIWRLHGHVVAEVFYDAAWHVYDPFSLGIIEDDSGNVGDISYLRALARENKLSKFNDVIRDEFNDRVFHHKLFPNPDPGDPFLQFQPREIKRFLNHTYVLTTNGANMKRIVPRNVLVSAYPMLGNFVREIRLDELPDEEPLRIDDYFPVSGAFVGFEGTADFPLPQILVTSRLVPESEWVNPETVISSGLNRRYLSFAPGINTLEEEPSHSITLRGISALRGAKKGAVLYTVHQYGRPNLLLDDSVKEHLRRNGIVVR